MINNILDLPTRIGHRLGGRAPDYRQYLFDDLSERLDGRKVRRLLEVGPRDGVDTRRLLTLAPEKTVLVDLPDKEEVVRGWLNSLDAPVELIVGNIMYDEHAADLEPFDVVWCTGVLYHNPEQLRMVRKLYDFVAPGGHLVIESATARRRNLRNENCIEIWHGVEKAVRRRYHVSVNITHLPSRRAIQSWLEMVGFEDVLLSKCHRCVTRGLASDRAAFLARRPIEDRTGTYYFKVGLDYEIGKAL